MHREDTFSYQYQMDRNAKVIADESLDIEIRKKAMKRMQELFKKSKHTTEKQP